MICYDSNRRFIQLNENEVFMEAGESIIYRRGDNLYKIFKKSSENMYRKLKDIIYETSKLSYLDGKWVEENVAIPTEFLFDGDLNFIGYKMKCFQGLSLKDFMKKNKRDKKHSYDELVALSYLLVSQVSRLYEIFPQLKSLGDVNFSNFLFNDQNQNPSIKFLDISGWYFGDNKPNTFTMDFAAPEVYSTKNYSKNSDLFSIGIIINILLVGYNPFTTIGDNEIQDNIQLKIAPLFGLNTSYKAPNYIDLKEFYSSYLFQELYKIFSSSTFERGDIQQLKIALSSEYQYSNKKDHNEIVQKNIIQENDLGNDYKRNKRFFWLINVISVLISVPLSKDMEFMILLLAGLHLVIGCSTLSKANSDDKLGYFIMLAIASCVLSWIGAIAILVGFYLVVVIGVVILLIKSFN